MDPQWTQTRLGDGFYEQRLVLDQITQPTGRRYLGNYADGVAQYRALLDGGVAEAGTLHLSVGVALTADQVAALTHDIVWMVEQEYQGQKVLVPVVYLSSKTALTLRSDGALLASDNGDVSLNATAGLSNTGTIGGANVSATAGNLLNQGRIVSSGTVQLQANQDLLNLGGQIAGRDVLLSAGRDLTSTTRDALAGGDLRSGITAGNNLLLQAGRDLSLTGTTVQAGNSAALLAGNNLTLQPTALRNDGGLMRGGDGTSLTVGNNLSLQAGNDLQLHGVAIAAGGDAALQAGHDLSLTPVTDTNGKATVRTSIATGGSLQLAAGNDLTIRQAQVKADGNLIAAAGHDLNVTSVLGDSRTVTDQSRQGKTKVVTTTTTQDIDQQALTAGGNLVLSAGHDVNLTAAKLDAGNGLAVVAGNDLNSTTLTTVDSSTTLETRKRFKQTTSTRDETVHGTEFTAGGDIALQSGRDVNLTAANLFTDKGALAVSAGNDVNLLTEQEQHDAVQDMQKKKNGFLSSKTTTTHDEWHDSTAVATTLSGDTVQIAAGHDLLSQGAQVAGTGNVVVAAGNDLTLETAQNMHSEEHDKKVKKTGLYSGGGFSVTLGASKQTNTLDTTEVSQSGSLVGSTDGSVTLTAGNAVAITGSDMLSKTGTAIVGKDVTIAAVENRVDTVQTSKQQSAGITLGLTGAVVQAAEAAYGATKRGSEVEDSRLQALYAAKAGYAVKDSVDAYQAADAQGAQMGGVSLRIGIGASSASSKTVTHEETTGGSRILSDGNVTIAATGGDLNVIGSKIDGQNVALAAANNLNLLSQQETNSEKSSNKNAGGEIGVSVGTTTGVYLTAYAGKGSAKGNSELHTESVVTAKDTLILASGNDTTIKGAQAIGDKVLAKVGGDLLIQSEQDTNDYKSKQQQAGVQLVYGYSTGGNASGYYSQQKIDSSYTSVKEQSGIQAGNGGFDVTVGGDTHLIGGAIASTADAERNRLTTNSLTVEDVQNKAEYKASSVGVSSDMASSATKAALGAALSLAGGQNGNTTSVTKSSVSAGSIEIRNGDDSAVANLDRNATELQQSGLKQIFDERKVQDQMEMAKVAGEVGFRTVGAIGDALTSKYKDAALVADGAERQLKRDDLTPEQRALIQQNLDTAKATMAAYQEQNDLWKDGGTGKTLMHAVAGAVAASLGGGNAMQGALGAGAAELARPLTEGESKLVQNLVSALVGGVAGGETGAGVAVDGENFNRQLHPDELKKINANAATFAAMECGDACTPQQVEAARQRLIVQAMRQTDSRWDSILGMGGLVAQDGNAQSFLSSITQTKGNYTDFGADWAQYNDHSMFADALRGTPALDQVYGAVLRTATSQDDQRHLLQALNRTDAGWTDDYVHGVLNRDAWAIGTTFTGDVGFVADVTHKLVTGDAKGALSAVAGAVVLSKVGELGGIVAGKAVTIIKEALNSTKGASDSVLPLVVKETATTGTAGDVLTEVPLLKPEAPNPNSVVDVPRGNGIDTSGLAGFPEVPAGYSTLKSGGAAANETGGLPDGFRRVVNQDGDVVLQSTSGKIYDSEEAIEFAKSGKIDGIPVAGTKPEWLKRLDDGNDFNKEQAKNYPYNEVYVVNPEGGYYRVDSYDPAAGEIISRKYTQLSEISEDAAKGYIREAVKKYSYGTEIADVKSTASELKGTTLQGKLILEVPEQKSGIAQSLIDYARNMGVEIRDVSKKVYK
ncbi:hemagglutinin repeat-containing protein [Xanthomonas sacchari]|uniref:hemagglutinin repeat-containing protein n=1 Tax=Xanthomonas sacchari TaxID=56458 RepID=UPI003D2F5378